MPARVQTFFVCLLFFSILFIYQPIASAQQNAARQSIPGFIDSWLNAWQAQDTNAYFSHYHSDFQPQQFSAIADWRSARTRNISRPSSISLSVETLTISQQGDGEAIVRFWLTYRAPDYADRTLKELMLSATDAEGWAIVGELNIEVEYLSLSGEELGLDTNSSSDGEPVDAAEPILVENGVQQPDVLTENANIEPAEEVVGTRNSNSESLPSVQTPETPRLVEVPDYPPVNEQVIERAAIEPMQEPTQELIQETLVETNEDLNEADTNVRRNQGQEQVEEQVEEQVGEQKEEREEWVPPGLENLNQPQITEIDIYYGGFYLTSVLAEFTNSELTFLERESLVDGLTNLKDPESFLLLLNRPFDANPDLLCFSDFQIDCGTIETDSVDIIFDQSRLRVWLFISPDVLLSNTSEQLRFLPKSEAGLSFLNQGALFFNGQDSTIDNYNLLNNTIFAWKENRLFIAKQSDFRSRLRN